MGEVFLAFDRLEGREVALKRLLLPDPTLTSLPIPPDLSAELDAATQLFIAHSDSSPTPRASVHTSAAPTFDEPTVLSTTQLQADVSLMLNGSRLSPELGAAPQLQAELRLLLTQEFHTLASLRHPHIISVLDYGFDTAQQPFFTMEYLGDAAPITHAATQLPLPERSQLLLQILSALTYLHRRGILHREPKIQESPSRNRLYDASSEKLRDAVNTRT